MAQRMILKLKKIGVAAGTENLPNVFKILPDKATKDIKNK